MSVGAGQSVHAGRMDAVYRYQRHFYDLTRKYYLLGRDRTILGLGVPRSGTVLEIGCGTGRNLIHAARIFPEARLFGIDISAAMLATAHANLSRRGLAGRIVLEQGDATRFDPQALFGEPAFDRIFVSYALSMIPGWKDAITAALAALKPNGSLHIVDFGSQDGLPPWFRDSLRAWLAKFHVSPRDSLESELHRQAFRADRTLIFDEPFRGYACTAIVGPAFATATP